MQKHIITIDGGTTNTRAYLWDAAGTLVAAQQRPVGVRDTAADQHDRRLRAAVRECLDGLLAESALGYADVGEVVASGMITSELGLLEVPHLIAPVSADDLAANLQTARIGDVCPLPIRFIPGVRNSNSPVTREGFEAMDMMRGEETETVALLELLQEAGSWLIILPGSHSKYVATDDARRITGCLTSLTGELLAAITGHTLLTEAVEGRIPDEAEYDREAMLLGFETAGRVGLGRACFSARILNRLGGEDRRAVGSFILGACLASDAEALRGSSVLRGRRWDGAVVAGRGILCQAMADMLRHTALFPEVRACGPGLPLSGLGARAILERAKGARHSVGRD